jgi:ABC-type antimicrobial peptide transport system permease subunit
MANTRLIGSILAVIGAIIVILSVLALATVGPGPTSRIVVTWAQDTTGNYGTITNVDIWASNESEALNGAALTGGVKLDELSAVINPDDLAYTFTVKNEGPPVYDSFGNEICQPINIQVTSIDTIVSDSGVPIPIVAVTTLNQLRVGMRDFADNNFLIEQRSAALGTLCYGASDTAKFQIELRPAAFAATTLAVGQHYYVRGIIAQQAFQIDVRVATTG